MLRFYDAAIVIYSFSILLALPGFPAPLPASSDAAGVLSGLSIASFSGSAVNSIQAVATDSSGNIYVTGTTSSFDFGVKSAAQPALGESRILRSTDLGVTWTHMGLPPSDVNVVVPDPVASQVIFAAGAFGVFRSTDGGQSWKTVYQFQPSDQFNGALVIDPGNHLRLAALVPSSGTFIRSLDGGNTWTSGSCPFTGCGGSLIADPSGSGALIGIAQGLAISRDWGVTFQQLTPGGFGSPTVAAFDPSNPGWIYVDTTAGVLGSLALSKDFGATWTAKASPPTTFSAMASLQVDPNQPNVLVAATAEGFYKSSDGANSWIIQGQPGGPSVFFPDAYQPFVLVNHNCSASGGLFAIGSSFGGTFHIDFSPDDGVTWMTPQLTGVTNVAMGPGCAAYATRPASTDAFAAKLAPDGTVQWATFLGGSDQDAPVALAVDAQGNCFVTGNTSSQDFPATIPLIGVPGQEYAFVTKFSPDGAIVFSAVIGGESANTAAAIAVDLSGSVYVGGQTNSLKFPVTSGVLGTSLSSGSYTGFLIKLSTNATLIYSTYLGPSYTNLAAILVNANNQVVVAGTGAAPGLPQPPVDESPAFIVKLDQFASQAISGAYLQIVNSANPTALALDANGNLLVFGVTNDYSFAGTSGAYASPPPPSLCLAAVEAPLGGNAFLFKLDPTSFQPVYGALLSSPCGFQTGAMTLDPSGAVVLAMATGAGLALKNPLVAGPVCTFNSSAIAKISTDGSSLQFATYLDSCGLPGVGVAEDGSIYAGVSSSVIGSAAAVLKFSATNAEAISLNQISNAFSGDASAVTDGGLYTLSGTGFQPSPVDLGINPSENLPSQLGGLRVLFDGLPASILEVAPGRVIVAAPYRLVRPRRGTMPPAVTPMLTSIQISYKGLFSNPVWMPVAASVPGLLTSSLLNPQPASMPADGYVENQDGTLNSATNPAAAGSTITLFATGMGATTRPDTPGSIATSGAISPETAVYATWRTFTFDGPNPPETVDSIPGFVSAMFSIPLQVPASVENSGQSVGNGVARVAVGLQLQVAPADYIPPASNLVGVYLK